jgi:hypothetical protein
VAPASRITLSAQHALEIRFVMILWQAGCLPTRLAIALNDRFFMWVLVGSLQFVDVLFSFSNMLKRPCKSIQPPHAVKAADHNHSKVTESSF